MLLIIAGQAGISWGAEIRAITRQFDAQVLTGEDLTAAVIARETAGEQYDVIHLAAHGDAEGFYLSENARLDVESAVRLGLSTQTKLMFLNACESVIPMQIMYARGVPYVVSHAVAVMDEKALEIATYYYGYLQKRRDFAGAFRSVYGDDGQLVMLPGMHSTPNVQVDRMRRRMVMMLAATLGQVVYRVVR